MKQKRFLFWLTTLASSLPFVALAYKFLTDQLGPQPTEALNKEFGEITFMFLVGNLALGSLLALASRPYRKYLQPLLHVRRPFGVACFCYAFLHLLFYIFKEGSLTHALTEMSEKTFLVFGLGAWIILFTLAITSNNWSQRKLKKKWKSLHRWVYVAFILASVHTLLIEKRDISESLAWILPIGVILCLRASKHLLATRPWSGIKNS